MSLKAGSEAGFACSVGLLAIGILVNLPLMLEQIARRVGPDLLNTATGLVYFISALMTAILTWLFGMLMEADTEQSSMKTLLVGVSLFILCFSMALALLFKKKNEFRKFEG
jgi:hypothetical protein